jgi:hypothetical protein
MLKNQYNVKDFTAALTVINKSFGIELAKVGTTEPLWCLSWLSEIERQGFYDVLLQAGVREFGPGVPDDAPSGRNGMSSTQESVTQVDDMPCQYFENSDSEGQGSRLIMLPSEDILTEPNNENIPVSPSVEIGTADGKLVVVAEEMNLTTTDNADVRCTETISSSDAPAAVQHTPTEDLRDEKAAQNTVDGGRLLEHCSTNKVAEHRRDNPEGELISSFASSQTGNKSHITSSMDAVDGIGLEDTDELLQDEQRAAGSSVADVNPPSLKERKAAMEAAVKKSKVGTDSDILPTADKPKARSASLIGKLNLFASVEDSPTDASGGSSIDEEVRSRVAVNDVGPPKPRERRPSLLRNQYIESADAANTKDISYVKVSAAEDIMASGGTLKERKAQMEAALQKSQTKIDGSESFVSPRTGNRNLLSQFFSTEDAQTARDSENETSPKVSARPVSMPIMPFGSGSSPRSLTKTRSASILSSVHFFQHEDEDAFRVPVGPRKSHKRSVSPFCPSPVEDILSHALLVLAESPPSLPHCLPTAPYLSTELTSTSFSPAEIIGSPQHVELPARLSPVHEADALYVAVDLGISSPPTADIAEVAAPSRHSPTVNFSEPVVDNVGTIDIHTGTTVSLSEVDKSVDDSAAETIYVAEALSDLVSPADADTVMEITSTAEGCSLHVLIPGGDTVTEPATLPEDPYDPAASAVDGTVTEAVNAAEDLSVVNSIAVDVVVEETVDISVPVSLADLRTEPLADSSFGGLFNPVRSNTARESANFIPFSSVVVNDTSVGAERVEDVTTMMNASRDLSVQPEAIVQAEELKSLLSLPMVAALTGKGVEETPVGPAESRERSSVKFLFNTMIGM